MAKVGTLQIAPTPQLAILWSLSFIVVLFFMLANLEKQIEFRSTIVFITVLVVSILGVLLIRASSRGKYLKGKDSFFFFSEPISVRTFAIFVPIGIIGAFGWSVLAQNLGLGDSGASLAALAGSGMIFLFLLIHTRSVIVPWVAHGAFNSIIFILQKTGAQSFVPQSLPIPEIGIPLGQVNQLITESIFQFALVGGAEEHYKILIIAFVLASFKDVFRNSPAKVWIAGIFAVLLWTILHLVNVIPPI